MLDAWFDSGSMPFAQHHRLVHADAPRELALLPQDFRPADFISEAVDQTRGWFYTLHVLAVALFDSGSSFGAAIATVRPWGVDVSSGVESRRGVKDPERIAAFMAAVREAESNNARH